AVDRVVASAGHARGSPAAALADVSLPGPRVEDAGAHPPLADLGGGERAKDPLGRGRDFDAGESEAFREIGRGPCGPAGDSRHGSSSRRGERKSEKHRRAGSHETYGSSRSRQPVQPLLCSSRAGPLGNPSCVRTSSVWPPRSKSSIVTTVSPCFGSVSHF